MKFLLIALCLIIALSNLGFGCSCIGESTVKSEIKRSDLVILGKVIDSSLVHVNIDGWETYKAQFRILVLTLFKGKVSCDTITIITGMGNGDCGYGFIVDSTYIIYAYRDVHQPYGKIVHFKNTFETDICSRTKVPDDVELRSIREYLKPRIPKSNCH